MSQVLLRRASGSTFVPASVLRLAVANGSTVDLYSYKDPFGSMTFVESFDLAGSGLCAVWSPNGQYLLQGKTSSPYAVLYKRTGDTLTKVQDITEPTGSVQSVAWSADSSTAYIGYGTTVSKYSRSGDTLTFVSSPGSLLAGSLQQSTGLSLSSDGAYLACAHATSPYITVYRVADWTKLANPATLPPSTGNGCSWHPNNGYLAVAHVTSPRVTLYSFASEVLTKVANPAVLPPGDCNGCAWGGSGTYLVLTGATSPRWHLYTFAGGTLTNVSTGGFVLPGTGYGVSALADKIACGHTGGNKLTLFTFDGTNIAAGPIPGTVPSFSGLGVTMVSSVG